MEVIDAVKCFNIDIFITSGCPVNTFFYPFG